MCSHDPADDEVHRPVPQLGCGSRCQTLCAEAIVSRPSDWNLMQFIVQGLVPLVKGYSAYPP
jgi:hypothetical protein